MIKLDCFSSSHEFYLCIQVDDSLLRDEEIYSCALVSRSFLDFLRLSPENKSPERTKP